MDRFTNKLSLKIRYLSLISMLLVVYVHAYTYELNGFAGALTTYKNYNTFLQDFISQGVARVATPLFFITSGFLFFTGFRFELSHVLLKYKKRVRSLLVPFLIWSLSGIVLYSVLQAIPFTSDYFSNRIIQDYTLSQLLWTLFVEPIPYQLWFLRDLIILAIISPAIWFIVKYLKESVLALMLIVWICDTELIFFTTEALFFFSLGCYLTIKPKLLKSFTSALQYQVYLVSWLGILVFKTELIYLGFENQIVMMLLHKVAILVGIVAVWNIINKIADKDDVLSRLLIHASVSPFFIFAFHEPMLTMLKKGLFKVLTFTPELSTILVYLFAPVIAILTSIFVAGFLKRYLPGLFMILTGNRDKPKFTKSFPQEPLPQLLTQERAAV